MRFAFWGGLLGALVAAGVQIQAYEMIHPRWIVVTALGSAVLAAVLGRPVFDAIKARFQRVPAKYR